MAVGSFGVFFVGVVSSQIARASNSVVLPLIPATALPASAGHLPERLAGFASAALVSLVVLTVLWPVPTVDPLRGPTIAVGRSLAGRLRRSFAALGAAELAQADASRQAAMAALSRAFLATPFRPTGLSTQTRLNVGLVEELAWLDRAISRWQAELGETAIDAAAADVLDACACALDRGFDRGKLAAALEELRAQLGRSERAALAGDEAGERDAVAAEAFVGRLEPSFRAQELAFAVVAIGETVEATLAAEGRHWWATLLGHQVAASDSLVT